MVPHSPLFLPTYWMTGHHSTCYNIIKDGLDEQQTIGRPFYHHSAGLAHAEKELRAFPMNSTVQQNNSSLSSIHGVLPFMPHLPYLLSLCFLYRILQSSHKNLPASLLVGDRVGIRQEKGREARHCPRLCSLKQLYIYFLFLMPQILLYATDLEGRKITFKHGMIVFYVVCL